VTFMRQPLRAEVSQPASESTRASSQMGHSVLVTKIGSATCAITSLDSASVTERAQRCVLRCPVMNTAPTVSKVARTRRSGADDEATRSATEEIDGSAYRSVTTGGYAADRQSIRPEKPADGHRLRYGLRRYHRPRIRHPQGLQRKAYGAATSWDTKA